jgi:hypothetical protein
MLGCAQGNHRCVVRVCIGIIEMTLITSIITPFATSGERLFLMMVRLSSIA